MCSVLLDVHFWHMTKRGACSFFFFPVSLIASGKNIRWV